MMSKTNTETEDLTYILEKFNKDEIIEKFLKSSNNPKQNKKITKKDIIKQAISLLTEKFSNLKELILYLHLKRFSKQILPYEEVSNSLVKYFNRYGTPCEAYSEKKGNCIWVALFIENTDPPKLLYLVAHKMLSVIFLSYMKAYPPETEKVLRKSLKGSEITQLNCITENALNFLNLNLKSFQILQKIKKRLKKNGLSKNALPENALSRKILPENALSRKILPENALSRKILPENAPPLEVLTENAPPLEVLTENAPPLEVLTENALLVKNKISEKIEVSSVKNRILEKTGVSSVRSKRAKLSSVHNRILEKARASPVKNKISKRVQVLSVKNRILKKTPVKRRISEKAEVSPEKKKSSQVKSKTYGKKNKISSESESACLSEISEEIEKDERKRKSPKKRFENQNLPIECLEYYIKSSPYYMEKENKADFSVCSVTFYGKNVLNGLEEMINSGIADGPLPDYLSEEPKTGKTKFIMTFDDA